ncbi:MAG: Fur family ferric uptake transcriptional regulator [Candidatus Paceibacteria bacterium]|jgi:Fur family ferric uptake transcriptional regulator
MRTNIYKDKIIKLLKTKHLLSISDIHKQISDADYSTVYRNVEQLISHGDIKKVVIDKDKIMYEVNNVESQHDHFVCTECGSIDELDRPVLKSLKSYVITDILVRGLCHNCN